MVVKMSFVRLAWVITLLAPFCLSAQEISPGISFVQQRLSASIESRFKSYPQEKVFVHVSQSVFLSGQTVWYKAYATAYGKPSDMSKIVYVRLSGENGKLVKQDKLPLKNAMAWGNIDLPDTLHSGWYRLQAFTAWMLNFDRRDIFSQVLYIQNPAKPVNPENLTVNTPESFHINFYPEGGKLIDATTGNIAFKAEDNNGMPVQVSGVVIDGQKNKLATINTVHDGMGAFSFETRADAVYTAQVRFPDNSVENIPLPKVERAGISMRVTPGSTDRVDLAFATTGQSTHIQNALLIALQNNGLAVTYPLQLSRGINVFGFNKKSFSSGVLHLGLFDLAGRLVAERSIFIDRGDCSAASIKTDTFSIAAEKTNALTLHIRDGKGHPLKANLSVSITDADMGGAAADNLGSFFLLSSETASYIPDPGYYFKNNSDTLRRQLDLLMLTSQAHYSGWDDIISNKQIPLAHAVEQSQFIAGRVEKYNRADNLKLKMMITAADSGKVVAFAEPDDSGIFRLDNYDSPGNADVLYEAVNRKNRKTDVKITFFNENTDTVIIGRGKLDQASIGNPGINIAYINSAAGAQLAFERASGIMLKTVKVKGVKIDPIQKMVDSHVKLYSSERASDFDLVDQPALPSQTIIDFLNGRVAGLQIIQSKDGGYVWMYNGFSNLGVHSPSATMKPYFYIDETYADESTILHLNISDVALIRFIPPPVWFAPLQGGFVGALMIYTKNREDYSKSYQTSYNPRPLLNQFIFDGYSTPREFSATSQGSRTTLFWAHDVQSDSKGVARLHFTPNGKTKKYRVVAQGMDKDGHPVYAEQIFTTANQ